MITPDEIRSARKRAGISQAKLAELVDVSQRTVGNWERGDSSPGIAEARLFAVLRDHLDDQDEPPLRTVSDVELLAEIARRLARGEQRERGEERDHAPATNPTPLTKREGVRRIQQEAALDRDED